MNTEDLGDLTAVSVAHNKAAPGMNLDINFHIYDINNKYLFSVVRMFISKRLKTNNASKVAPKCKCFAVLNSRGRKLPGGRGLEIF